MSRRLRVLAAVGALALVPLVPAAAQAAEAPAAPLETAAGHFRVAPVGVWNGTVTFPDGQIEARMSFRANGKLCLIAPPPGPDGGVEGKGTWRGTGRNTFTFTVTERFFDGSGATTAVLRATHRATLRGDRFTTEGEGAFYDASGQQQGSFPVTSQMQRESRADAC
ncbi:hypothetical protein ABZY20_07025 [Streptomyces sp. NPDC006624]|uniref:hypothetical protein n=1 Tax=Streptomyces sp. NPDC006624 TaxID=3154892 RepID=UPI0033B6F1C2